MWPQAHHSPSLNLSLHTCNMGSLCKPQKPSEVSTETQLHVGAASGAAWSLTRHACRAQASHLRCHLCRQGLVLPQGGAQRPRQTCCRVPGTRASGAAPLWGHCEPFPHGLGFKVGTEGWTEGLRGPGMQSTAGSARESGVSCSVLGPQSDRPLALCL